MNTSPEIKALARKMSPTPAQDRALMAALAEIDGVIARQRRAFRRGDVVPVSERVDIAVAMDGHSAPALVGLGFVRWHASMEGHVRLTLAGIERASGLVAEQREDDRRMFVARHGLDAG